MGQNITDCGTSNSAFLITCTTETATSSTRQVILPAKIHAWSDWHKWSKVYVHQKRSTKGKASVHHAVVQKGALFTGIQTLHVATVQHTRCKCPENTCQLPIHHQHECALCNWAANCYAMPHQVIAIIALQHCEHDVTFASKDHTSKLPKGVSSHLWSRKAFRGSMSVTTKKLSNKILQRSKIWHCRQQVTA